MSGTADGNIGGSRGTAYLVEASATLKAGGKCDSSSCQFQGGKRPIKGNLEQEACFLFST
jgi:hypothetical protein